MEEKTLQSSHPIQIGTPDNWKERFVLKRFDDEDIILSLEERNRVLAALNQGDRFVQIRKYTVMVNAIKSIDPYWGEKNIPPKPQAILDHTFEKLEDGTTVSIEVVVNQEELDLWESLFGNKQRQG